MRAAILLGICRSRLALGCLAIGLAAGCRAPQGPPPEPGGGLIAYRDSLTPQQDRTAQLHALFALTIHHELAGAFDLAEATCRQGIALSPTNEAFVVRLGALLVAQHKTEEALTSVEEFVARNPDAAAALLWLARVYHSTGEAARCLELLQRLTRQRPDLPQSWVYLAGVTADGGNTNAAENILRDGATKAQPPTLLLRELLRMELGRYLNASDVDTRKAAGGQTIERLRQIIAREPSNYELQGILGRLLIETADYPAACEVYEKLIRREPTVAEHWEKLAQSYLLSGERERALATLEQVANQLDLPPGDRFSIGDLYREAKDFTNAAAHYKLAAEASPEDTHMWVTWAAMYGESEPEKALEILRRALAHNPKSIQVMEIMALLYQHTENFAAAAEWQQTAYDLIRSGAASEQPSQFFHYNFALVCTHLRRTADAAHWLQLAIEQDPHCLAVYVQHGFSGTPTHRRRVVQVLRALTKLPTASPAAVHWHLGNMYAFLERPKAALAEYNKVIAIAERDPLQSEVLNAGFYFWYGVALDETGQTERAIAMFERCLQKDPTLANAHNYLAYTWAVRGERLADALRHIQIALVMEPENAAFLDTLGWVYFQQGQYADALKMLEKADQLRPNDPEIEDHLAQTREKLAAPANE